MLRWAAGCFLIKFEEKRKKNERKEIKQNGLDFYLGTIPGLSINDLGFSWFLFDNFKSFAFFSGVVVVFFFESVSLFRFLHFLPVSWCTVIESLAVFPIR